MKFLIPAICIFFLFGSCQKKKIEEQAKKDKTIITEYLSKHNINAVSTSSGLYYSIEKVGLGTKPLSTSQVRVSYKGYFSDKTVFDESDDQGVIFGLESVIKGWTEGIPYFNEGGSGKLYIPSSLAYGTNGTTGIPANSVLIFDIKLLDVY